MTASEHTGLAAGIKDQGHRPIWAPGFYFGDNYASSDANVPVAWAGGKDPSKIRKVRVEVGGEIEEVTVHETAGPLMGRYSGMIVGMKYWPAMTATEKKVALCTAAKKNRATRELLKEKAVVLNSHSGGAVGYSDTLRLVPRREHEEQQRASGASSCVQVRLGY
mmetsp:Transcript_122348/g.346910  ORF Transcript_122348/g.346910 Transcript_122348/m.346910 type:complete len:164 (-) Transcript_122348:34-525(-)|eukprot:CAMPEP_0179242330 /NCGR_PEP_ID=MMETSP0797-20121207/16962_1 /TAXON_ID=47934 /ORGANISM="Dinophysis acuminata, Strain DAEP01" /LENGTH=163 /DNA_ID=CAMNT_0020949763 /DNA_START=127 /DNA_END=618 /DNA_ORIENTATION=+